MATDENGDAPNRATVALVAEKVEGLRELTRNGFTDLQRQLDGLVSIPKEVAELREKHNATERRVSDLEDETEKHREWTRGPLLLISVGIVIALINLIPVVIR